VFQLFREFQKFVERFFFRKIITMQTNSEEGGGEYQKLKSFFKEVGISHHVSCPHTHQQNGLAERKHRYIIEVGLSLLSHSSIPLKYWDEAFLTATYLINHMPSCIIQEDTPYHRVFKEPPNYNFLRIFGCVCWPNLCLYNAHRL
jgi:hypothetical protein